MMRPFTDEEFKELPHVLWMSEDDWDPASFDSVISDDPNWYEAEPSPPLPDPMYDEYGEFCTANESRDKPDKIGVVYLVIYWSCHLSSHLSHIQVSDIHFIRPTKLRLYIQVCFSFYR
jgi:hypothetical protein